MKIALVYDRINKYGGAERVLQALHRLYPNAPLYTAVYHPDKAEWVGDWPVHTSFVNRLPFAKGNHEAYVMFMPYAFESMNFDEYQIIITVTSAEAKGIITKPGQLHLCYLLTPTRYLWSHTHHYSRGKFRSTIMNPFMSSLRKWDYVAAKRPDQIITISHEVAQRCHKFYDRKPEAVIYPPVDIQKLQHDNQACLKPSKPYYLVVSRLVSYKNVDLVIDAFNQLPAVNLIIIGTGRYQNQLEKQANQNISFVSNVNQSDLTCYLNHAQALIMPQEEDFGIVSVEAQAVGTPVIALNKGGARETVSHQKTGWLFDQANSSAIIQAVKSTRHHHWDKHQLKQNAAKFDIKEFSRQFKSVVEAAWQQRQVT